MTTTPSQPAGPGAARAEPMPTTLSGPPPAPARVTVGRLVGRTFSTWKALLLPFAALGVVYQLGYLALGWATGSPFGPFSWNESFRPSPDAMAWVASPAYFAYLLSSFVLSFLLMGAFTGGAVQHLAGRRASVAGTLGAALRRMPALVGAGILGVAAIYVGLILLVVPGVLWGLSFSLAAPVVIAEELGPWASLKRSRALAKGSRWALLGSYVICGLAAGAPTWLGMGLAMASPVWGGVLVMVAGVVLGPIILVAPAVAWQELRMAKEGASAAELAKVFE
jgi:MFS family permease